MADRIGEILETLPFLEGADTDVVERLASGAAERTFQPGETVFQEGSTGREIYLILEGQVEVVKGSEGEEMLLARRGPGDVLGEMGFIEASPRFATVRALGQARLLELSEQGIQFALAEHTHLLYRTIQVLSARLRESELHMLADLQHKNRELAQAYQELKAAQAALVEKERLERELELARDLQQQILPLEFPQVPGFECAARSQPARQVGGDFYDVISLGKGRVGLVMADVSDKGMAAALYMALTHSLLHAEARRRASPRQVLLRVHRLLLEMSRADMFVTAFYGVLDVPNRTLHYARGGHDRPLHVRPDTGECRFLDADGMLLGYVQDVTLDEASVEVGPGDLLVLYTDGITDANAPSGEFFGVDRLREAVCKAGSLGPQGLCDAIFEQVLRFQADAAQHDDMALLVVRVGGE